MQSYFVLLPNHLTFYRVGWASYKNKKEPRQGLLHHDRMDSSSVHISYISYQLKTLITEESLRILFSTYGVVLDTSIKKSYIDDSITRQCGYGFVHFSCSPEGIQSALAAVTGLNDATLDGVCYKCSISHNLEKALLDRQQQQQMPQPHYRYSSPAACADPSFGAGHQQYYEEQYAQQHYPSYHGNGHGQHYHQRAAAPSQVAYSGHPAQSYHQQLHEHHQHPQHQQQGFRDSRLLSMDACVYRSQQSTDRGSGSSFTGSTSHSSTPLSSAGPSSLSLADLSLGGELAGPPTHSRRFFDDLLLSADDRDMGLGLGGPPLGLGLGNEYSLFDTKPLLH